MPRYDYECLDCHEQALSRYKRPLTSDEYDELVLFETSHSAYPTDSGLIEATTCPRCGGTNCTKSFVNTNVIGYIRGNGYLDKAGTRRDMNLYHLMHDDPYSEYRVPGEVDELKAKLKRAGQHDPKRKYFDVTTSDSDNIIKN